MPMAIRFVPRPCGLVTLNLSFVQFRHWQLRLFKLIAAQIVCHPTEIATGYFKRYALEDACKRAATV